jgi:hypothetical protein
MKIMSTKASDYMDMEGQIEDTITVDEYVCEDWARIEISLLVTFTTNSKLAAQDLVTWF